jgi:starch phosphorylase
LLHDAERFAGILNNAERPVQIIVAGKSHPNDDGGKAMVQRIAWFAWRDDLRERVVFLEDYDMVLAQHFAAGVDVWVNNPRRPAEACGTSGMKMLVNGGLHCSTLDGWWDEAYTPEVGWAIGDQREHSGEHDGDDARRLYELLENEIVPEFYDRDEQDIPCAWVSRIRASMSRLTEQFSSDRMVREYVERTYLPAAAAFLRRAGEDAKLARELEQWHAKIEDQWTSVRFGRVQVTEADQTWQFHVQAYLGDLSPDCVAVHLFAESIDGGEPTCITMRREGPIHGAVGGFIYHASVPANRPADHFTARIVPDHKEAFVPLEAGHSTWHR